MSVSTPSAALERAPHLPLRFERIYQEKVWGGRTLERCPGLALPAGKRIGETWEVVDREGENSRVADGPWRGASLGELVARHREALLGTAPANARGRFPLLVKYIDASEALSVQVHPSDESAARIGSCAEGKTEAWYVLAAEPGARLYCGLRAGVGPRELERCMGERAVLELLRSFEARAGECLLVPGGTVHAIGAGVTLLEVQQNSDTTYRIWDWDRLGLDGRPRETHPREALAASAFDLPEQPPVAAALRRGSDGHARAPLARTSHFALELLELDARARLATGGQYRIYCVVRGSGTLEVAGGTQPLARGDCWLVPACAEVHEVEPAAEGLTLVQVVHRA
jgi:mannose-6-phosphate isomerase